MSSDYEYNSSDSYDLFTLYYCDDSACCSCHDLSVKPIVEPLVVMDVSIYPSIRVFCNKFYKIYEEKYEKIDLFI